MSAPWPDLVISAGRKNEPIARWVRARALAKRQATRLIHVGRPWAAPPNWDLVIDAPIPDHPNDPNILHNDTPLHRVTRARLDEDAKKWADRVAHLPKPLIAVLCGGNSGPTPSTRPRGAPRGRRGRPRERVRRLAARDDQRTLPETTEALFEGIQSPSISTTDPTTTTIPSSPSSVWRTASS